MPRQGSSALSRLARVELLLVLPAPSVLPARPSLTGPGVGTPSSGLPPRRSSCLLRPTVDSEAPILLEPPTHLEARQRGKAIRPRTTDRRESGGLDMLREERKPGGKHARRVTPPGGGPRLLCQVVTDQ